jgi:predicted metal-dependent HD superfamily phosphohydrolase
MEYATEIYSKDRLKMLKTLLMIPYIYSNETIRDKYEVAARTNIKNEIDILEKQ